MDKKSQSSKKSLVIVESPAKAKTINRYLGARYEVQASMGHVRDLPANDFGIEIGQGFEPTYEVLPEKRKVVAGLRKAVGRAGDVYLATDMDREGEAIAWHLVHALDLADDRTHRVVFNEITEPAIREAFAHPHHLDMNKVNAQQARRLLDRIVGYQLSPLLQSKIARGLSAGRVQSVAVRLIVEREREIETFVPEESWRVLGFFATDLEAADRQREEWAEFISAGNSKGSTSGPTVKARNKWLSDHACLLAEMTTLGGREFNPKRVEDAVAAVESLGFVTAEVDEQPWEMHADKDLKIVTLHGRVDPTQAPRFTIKSVQRRRTITRPNPPFTTAGLQQAASSELGFAPSRTMRIAQQLYEGIDLGGGEGPVGLITYMRTDSTNLSAESIRAVRELIGRDYGPRHLPDKPNRFGKAKRAQEAHEAIRPSDVGRRPETVQGSLTREQFKLYDLIWRRFVACQMTPAEWDGTTVLIAAGTPLGEVVFKSTGRRLVFEGFLCLAGRSNGEDVILPELDVDVEVSPLQIDPQQQYTSPPARYSEAALVKKLESEGIGRPSTYAAIIQTIQDRGYVDLADKRLRPTERGKIVTEKLVGHFPRIMDVKFTSHMEEELDKVEEARVDWMHVLSEFYEPFKASLDRAGVEMERPKAEPSGYDCPECGKGMVYRIGRNGRFLACSAYPDCKVSMNIDAEGKPVAAVVAEQPCAMCGKPMILRRSRLGPFLGCTGYPECTNTLPSDEDGVPLKKVEPEDIKETCDDCSSAMVVKFARGRAFLGCSNYPKCKSTKPMPPGVYVEKPKPQEAGVRCDKCGRPVVIRRGRRGPFLSCSGFPRCRNAMPMDKLDHLKALAERGEIPDPPADTNGNGRGRNGSRANGKDLPRDAKGKVDIAALGQPPEGFAWTRTGRPVVETWPEEPLTCPECGSEVTLKNGRFGPYFGCTGYPKCSFVSNLRGEAKKRAEAESPRPVKPKPIPTGIPCDECGEPMVIRTGRTGPFLGCSKYPKCRGSKPFPEGETTETLAASTGK